MEHEDQKLEAMIERLLRDETLESPSLEFTDKVMQKIHVMEGSPSTLYKPLISWKVWLLIGLLFISMVTYVIYNGNSSESQWLKFLEIPNLSLDLFAKLNVRLSEALKYGTLLFTVMIGVQLVVLKSYFDRRLSF